MTEGQLKIDKRRSAILELLRREKYVRVPELSRMLGITQVTVRSDLAALEAGGHLLRTQGGAVLPTGSLAEEEVKGIHNYDAKWAVAQRAASEIPNGSTLLINHGTTTLLFARALKSHKDLHIVTNSYPVAKELSDIPSFRVLLLGGELDTHFDFTTGDEAKEQLLHYQADRAVLAVDGVSVAGGVTTYHAAAAALNRLMSQRASRTIVIADHSKIGRCGFTHICEVSSHLQLITDREADPSALQDLENAGLSAIIAP